MANVSMESWKQASWILLGRLKMVAWIIFHSLKKKHRFSSITALSPENSSDNVDHLWKI